MNYACRTVVIKFICLLIPIFKTISNFQNHLVNSDNVLDIFRKVILTEFEIIWDDWFVFVKLLVKGSPNKDFRIELK